MPSAGKRMPLPIYRRKRHTGKRQDICYCARAAAHTQGPKIDYAEGRCKSVSAFTLLANRLAVQRVPMPPAGKRMPLPITEENAVLEAARYFLLSWVPAHTQKPKITYGKGSCKSS